MPFFSRNSSGSTTSTTTNNTKDGVAEIELLRPLGQTVVKVIEPSPRHKRLVGYIVEKKDNAGVTNTKKKNFQLQPTDSRMPTCDIDASLSELKDLENVPENVIVFASMVDVEGKARGALSRMCSVERVIGPNDSIESHTVKILLENDIKDEPFTGSAIRVSAKGVERRQRH